MATGRHDDRTIEMMLDHNAWANRALVEACRALDDDALDAVHGIGPGSIRATLVHLGGAMLRWADRIRGVPLRPSPEDAASPPSLDAIARLLDEGNRELRDAIDAMQASIDEPMSVRLGDERQWSAWRFPRRAAVLHVLTHGVHHRAQVLNMLRRAGAATPDLDVIECVATETRSC